MMLKNLNSQSSVTGKGKINMSENQVENQGNISQPTTANNDKDLNFRRLEEKYERELQKQGQELQKHESARRELERKLEELSSRQNNDDDDDDEPYVDNRKLKKKLAHYGESFKKETQSEIQKAIGTALQEERRQNWIKNNADFYETLKHADKLAESNPDLAEAILEMPDGFERQKLVYKNIKALNLDAPMPKEPSIQDKINANRKSPYYQPSGVGTSPYQSTGDFSKEGQRSAYEKMQKMKKMMRLG